MLRVNSIDTHYGDIQALYGVSLNVEEGEIVTIIGANGAGKSTTLRTITGLIHPSKGNVEFCGEDISELKPERIAAKGIIMVPEGRRIFPGLTVLENLELGTCSWRKKQSESFQEDLDKVFQLFPRLKERSGQLGWSLSGGEQQMLALARGFMGHPRVLLLDEPSLGLAPKIVEEMFETIVGLHKMGVTILLVEQNAFMALEIATRAYVLQTGEIVMAGPADEIRDDPQIARAYLSA